jgi:hypothetical protein
MPGLGNTGHKFTDLWIGTRTKFASDVINMIERSHPLLEKITGNGDLKAKYGEVGKRVVEPILARTNDNAKFMNIDDVISFPSIRVLEQIEYDWKFLVTGISINDKITAINNSMKLIDLISNLNKATTEGLKNTLIRQIYAHGKDSKEFGGLRYLINDNPYQPDLTVLQLMRGLPNGAGYGPDANTQNTYAWNYGDALATYPSIQKFEFWRNRAGYFVGNPYDNPDVTQTAEFQRGPASWFGWINAAFRRMIQVLNYKNPSKVDMILTDPNMYNYLIKMREPFLQLDNTPAQKTDFGFDYITYNKIPIFMDEECPPWRVYFLTSNTLKFKYLEGENFIQERWKVPNKFEHMYLTTFMGNFICDRARFNGVLYCTKTKESGAIENHKAWDTVDWNLSKQANLTDAPYALPGDCNVADPDHFKNFDYAITPFSQDAQQVGDTWEERTTYSASGAYRDEETYKNKSTTPPQEDSLNQ